MLNFGENFHHEAVYTYSCNKHTWISVNVKLSPSGM